MHPLFVSDFSMLKYLPKILFLFLIFTAAHFSQNLEKAERYYKKYEYANALKYFLKAETQKEEGYKLTYYEIAYCLKNIKEYKKAISYLNKSLKVSSKAYNKYSIYWLYAECYYMLGEYHKMSGYFRLAKEASPVPDFIPTADRFLLDGYEYITTSDIEDIYLKTNSLKKQGNIIKVWLKYYWDGITIPEQDELKLTPLVNSDIKLYWQKRNQEIEDIKLRRYYMKYYLQYIEFDRDNNTYNVLKVNKYDDKGNVLQSDDLSGVNEILPNKGWSSIFPNSLISTIYQYICHH
jgi:tetratricopeptide (TPR) repeat protein